MPVVATARWLDIDEEKMLRAVTLSNLIAVSYTHLDVYKRQACTSSCSFASTEGRLVLLSRDAEYSLKAALNASTSGAVSHTHLDVYKRQDLT